MKYAVDRIENDIAVLENLNDGDILEVKVDLLPAGIKEKDIVVKKENSFLLDEKGKDDRLRRIREKMNKLKKH